jgi:ketosteroid isomerase-like protein
MTIERVEIARGSYLAFAAGDRSFFEERLSDDFRFSSPPDPDLDRDGWFERCCPALAAARSSGSFGSSDQSTR